MQYIITFPTSKGYWIYDDVVCGGKYMGNIPIKHNYYLFNSSSASNIDSYLDLTIRVNQVNDFNKSTAIIKALDPITNPELFI